ncbi:marr-Family protein [Arthrobacter sp. Hiyo1]|nr:marr-Family protein [Arthrobacter sp. Hiyo1]
MTTSNIASALRELDAGGYVTRGRDANDGRRVNVMLTDKGRTAMAHRRAKRSTHLQHAIEATLDDREQGELVAAGNLLERISNFPAS